MSRPPAQVATAAQPCHLTQVRRALAIGLLAVGVGCGRGSQGGAGVGGGKAGDKTVLARIDDRVITVGEVEAQINAMNEWARRRYSSPQQKKRFVESLVQVEVMAREAERRGYDRDPDVVRQLKQHMISKLVSEEIDRKVKPESVSQADVERYYREHVADFQQPEQVRVSQILISDEAVAKRVAAEARAAAPAASEKIFRELVAGHSEDEDSKPRDGDLAFIDRGTTRYPKEIVEAAFVLERQGDLSPLVKTDRGYHLLRLTQRRPGFTRQLAEVAPEVRRLVLNELRARKMQDMVAEVRQRLKVEIYEDELAKVQITEATKR
jgi:peptidyl-prolyl cis-trans isomerase C